MTGQEDASPSLRARLRWCVRRCGRAGTDVISRFLGVGFAVGRRLRLGGVKRVVLRCLRRGRDTLRSTIGTAQAERARRAAEEAAAAAKEAAFREVAELVRRRGLRPARPGGVSGQGERPLRVTHVIGSLNAGGAERQLCNLAGASAERGMEVRVLCTIPLEGEFAHYAHLLEQTGVTPRFAGDRLRPEFAAAAERHRREIDLLPRLCDLMLPETIDLFGELVSDPPDIVHAWLDHTNVWGGVAALLADVPIVVLSTRNVNPTNFPYLHHPDFRAWYGLLAGSPRVHLINNSTAGARDYAEWLGIDAGAFDVILNGVDFSTIAEPTPAEIDDFRRELGLPPDARVVAGVFRMSAEKEPLAFVEVARRLIEGDPNLYVVVAGVGMLASNFRRAVHRAGIGSRVRILGRRTDVPTILTVADVCLLASRFEGTPNVLLEAQHLGCPVVSTRAGGAIDAVHDGHTGILCNIGDVDGLTEAVAGLLRDDRRRKAMAAAGPGFIRQRFGLGRMVDETVALYDRAMAGASRTPAPIVEVEIPGHRNGCTRPPIAGAESRV